MRRLPARVAILVAAMFLTVGVAAWALAVRENTPDISPRPEAKRPALMLLTTLPLVFPEEFSLQGGGSKALTALETRYRVVPIATTDAKSLGQGRMLMLAHPLAQPAEALVDLDRWVRDGGRVMLLADPRLEWPSSRPLGDKLRPPPAFADTGLLAHWGLALEPPYGSARGKRELGGRVVFADSPGTLSGSCRLGELGFVAHCSIGKGKATVVADADFLNADQLEGGGQSNLDGLLAELAQLEG